VQPRNAEHHVAQWLAVFGHGEAAGAIAQLDAGRPHVRAGIDAVSHDPDACAGGEPTRACVILAQHHAIGDPGDELGKCLVDGFRGAVDIQVIGLHGGHHGHFRSQREEGAVVLVGLDHEDAVRARAQAASPGVDAAADESGRIQAGFREDGRRHGRRTGLAVRPGDGEDQPVLDERRECLRTLHDGDAAAAGGHQLRVVHGHRRRRDDGRGAPHVIGVVAFGDVDTEAGQRSAHRSRPDIATGHVASGALEQLRERGHARAADAHEVDRPRTRQGPQVEIRGRSHARSTSVSRRSAMSRAA
jgi:hypothetical protein